MTEDPTTSQTPHPPTDAGPGDEDPSGSTPALSARMRIRWRVYGVMLAFLGAEVLVGYVLVLTFGVDRPVILSLGAIGAAVLFVPFGLLFANRLFDSWQVDVGTADVVIERGVIVHRVTTIPRSRIQHADISSTPIDRAQDVCTLSLYTAGTPSAAVRIPGLAPHDAEALREHLQTRDR